MAQPLGYFRSTTALEPRPNDIITFSPGLGWTGSSSFTGKDMKYENSTSVSTTNFTFTGVYASPTTYYSKGIVFIDEVHKRGIIPAGESWPVDVYAAYSSDLTDTDETLYCGVFVWRGATDSLLYTVGTAQWTGLTTSYTLYQTTETNAADIDLWPGDRICVEFYGGIRVLAGSQSLNKWAISIRYNDSTVPSKLTYPSLREVLKYNMKPGII